MSDIGDLIKEHRLACNLSQKKLGDACGISDAEIMRIENCLLYTSDAADD